MFSEEMSNALRKKCQILGQILAALVRILSFPRMNMNSYVDYCELSYEQREKTFRVLVLFHDIGNGFHQAVISS